MIPTQDSWLSALDQSIHEVVGMMSTAGLDASPACPVTHPLGGETVQVCLSVSGQPAHRIRIIVSSRAALGWTAELVGQPQESIDEMVLDAVGELGNMIAGATKSKLSTDGVSRDLSIPSVRRTTCDGRRGDSDASAGSQLRYGYAGGRIEIAVEAITD
ncbi:MAG: chemotaxis protein CheX [Planctomycetota bacterium]